MATGLVGLESAPWHVAECAICGCPIHQKNLAAYWAFSTQSGSNIMHRVQSFDGGTLIAESRKSYSGIRMHATSPELRLLHVRCYNILRCIWTGSTIPLTTISLIIAPAFPIASKSRHPISHLDAAALIATFGTPKAFAGTGVCPKDVCKNYIPESLLRAIRDLPIEVCEMILLNCGPRIGLAIACCIGELSMFNFAIKMDIARKRIAMCKEANQLLGHEKYSTHHTERLVTLSEKMKATFIRLGGEMYLQDITLESSCPEAVDVFIESGRPAVLALHVDQFGIRNIAFALDNAQRPKWIRGDTRIHAIFLDEGRTFERLRIVSDVSTRNLFISLNADCKAS